MGFVDLPPREFGIWRDFPEVVGLDRPPNKESTHPYLARLHLAKKIKRRTDAVARTSWTTLREGLEEAGLKPDKNAAEGAAQVVNSLGADSIILLSSALMILPVGVSGITGTSRICDGRLYDARCSLAYSANSAAVSGESGRV